MEDDKDINNSDQTKEEKASSSNAKIANAALGGAANYFGGKAGGAAYNAVASTKFGQEVINAAGNELGRQAKRLPGGQQMLNKVADSGAVEAANSVTGTKDNVSSKEQNNAVNNNSQQQERSSTNKGDAKGAKSRVKKLAGNKLIKIRLIIAAVLLVGILLLALLSPVIGDNNGGTSTGETYNRYFLSEQETPEYRVENVNEDYDIVYDENGEPLDGIWDQATAAIFNGQTNFNNRYRVLYAEYRLFHPGLNKEMLTATRLHLLSTLHLDYTPEEFTEDIVKYSELADDPEAAKRADDGYDEDYGYKVCSEDYASPSCNSKILTKEDYLLSGIVDFLAKILGGLEKVKEYFYEQDSMRNLMRNFIVYVGTCKMERESRCSSGTEGCICENNNCVKTEKDTKYYEPLTLIELIKKVLSFGKNPDYEDCKSYEEQGWKINFEYTEQISYCKYYEYLIEEDYFEKHPHFKDDFERIKNNLSEGQTYEEEALKEKKILVNDIIEIVDSSDDSDPIMVGQSINDDYTSYTLSNSMHVTVLSDSKGENGGSYTLDEYVSGVLMDEVGVFYHYQNKFGYNETQLLETWKAMAVAIRSYTLARTNGGTQSIRNSSADQNFTAEYLNSTTKQAVLAKKAVSETQGQILTVNGGYFGAEYDAFYKKTEGGETIKGGFKCDDSFCSVTYLKKGSNNSNTYHLVSVPASWKSKLSGGHGRGMSQYGALYLASQGYNYVSILDYFYADEVDLVHADFSTGDAISVDPEDIIDNGINISSANYDPETGEQMLTCKYDIKIPLRTTGVTAVNINGEPITDGGTTTIPITGESGEVIKGDDLVANARQFIGRRREEMASLIDTSSAWCARFVSYIFSITEGVNMDFRSASVSGWTSYFQGKNQFYNSNYWASKNKYPNISEAGGPKVGDIIFFASTKCYDGSGNLPPRSEGCIRHIGIVTGTSGNTVTYTHGNTSLATCGGTNGVCEDTNSVDYSYIIGYGRWE